MEFTLSTVNLINALLLTIGIGVCGMCYLHITVSVNLPRKFRRYFQYIFITLPIYIAAYLARVFIEGLPGPGISVALRVLPTAEIVAAGLICCLISRLLIFLTKPRRSRLLFTGMYLLLLAHIVLVIAGSFSHVFFYIEGNVYHRGFGYLLVTVLPVLMALVDILLLIRYGIKITRRVRFAFWMYILLPLIAIAIQAMCCNIQFIALASVLSSVFMYTVIVIEQMVESRDQCTGDHVHKTAEYTRLIMDQMRKDGAYKDQLTDEFMADVVRSAPLHDIGKIHVPDAILNKPGKLSPEEFEQIKEHTTAGRDIIGKALDMVVADEASGYLHEAQNLAYCHHEKWNGTGYPQGLSGENIPLSARIMAVADVFDALISKRSYKDAFPFEKAMDIIREGVGTHFDPKVAEAFLRAESAVRKVAYGDRAA